METTSWAVWSLRWAKWPARQPAGVSTGRWFDMTTLQSDGGAGEGWPQVSVCCQSSSNITGRSQSNDTAAFSCNFVFTLGFWSPHQRTVAVGPFGKALCSYLLSFFKQKMKCVWGEWITVILMINCGTLLLWWEVFVDRTTKCWEGSHTRPCSDQSPPLQSRYLLKSTNSAA